MTQKRKIILIGGAPATGKSTIAHTLSKELECPWFSTDFVRAWMKQLVSNEDYPELFNFAGISAEEHYKKFSVSETIASEKARDTQVFKGVKAFIETNCDWSCYIVEGISIHPDFLTELNGDDYEIYPLFLIDLHKERIKEILHTRGLWGDAHTYEDWVKDIELEYLIETNREYQRLCEEYKLPYFKIGEDRNETILRVKEYLTGFLV